MSCPTHDLSVTLFQYISTRNSAVMIKNAIQQTVLRLDEAQGYLYVQLASSSFSVNVDKSYWATSTSLENKVFNKPCRETGSYKSIAAHNPSLHESVTVLLLLLYRTEMQLTNI